MGDMADYILSSIDYGHDYISGYDEDEHEPPLRHDKTCRCCGRKGLQWGQRNGKWRLFDNRGIHVCKVNPLKD